MVSEAGLSASAGDCITVNPTPTVWGLPVITVPPLTAASEIVPEYVPAMSAADVILTVKVWLLPATILADEGETASHPVPVPSATLGVMVTSPAQVPVTATVNVLAGGFVPTSVVALIVETEGACSVHGGCMTSVTAICKGAPIGAWLTLSVAVMVIVPL